MTFTPTPAPQFIITNGSMATGNAITFYYSFDYQVFSDWCPGCVIQLVTGWGIPGSQETTCAYNGVPGASPGASGSVSDSITLPSTPGTYYLVVEYHAQYSCADALAAYGTAPALNRIVLSGPEVRPSPTATATTTPTLTPTPTIIPGGFTLNNTVINGSSSPAIVTPGAPFTLTYNFSVWSQGDAPGWIVQLVTGRGSAGVGTSTCGYNGQPGVFPGVSGSATIPMTAPSTLGIYLLNTEYHIQFNCADAINAYNGSGVPGSQNAGQIIVGAPAAGPVSLLGGLWYLGAPGESCNTVCAGRGGINAAVFDLVGNNPTGTLANCDTVLDSLLGAGTTMDWAPAGSGVGCHLDLAGAVTRARYIGEAVNPAASSGNVQRVCSCNN